MTTAVMAPVADAPKPASWLLRASLRAVMPIADLVVAIVWFTISVTGLSPVRRPATGLPGGPVGLRRVRSPDRLAGVLERARMKLFLGMEIASVPLPQRAGASGCPMPPTWRAIGYSILSFPLAVLTFTVTISGWALPFALLTMPWWLHRVPSRRADLWVLTVQRPGDRLVALRRRDSWSRCLRPC